MCLVIFCKDLVELVIDMISICLCRLFSHLDSAVRHERSLQRFVCLKSDDFLKILCGFIDVSCAVSGQSGNDLCFTVKHASLCALLFL